MRFLDRIKAWAGAIKRDVIALWLAARDPRVAWYAKALAGLVAAYALSPIDLIPDFIPVLGFLDDLILVPLGIAAVVAMIAPPVLADLRQKAAAVIQRPRSLTAAYIIIALWTIAGLCVSFVLWVLWRR